MTLDGEIMALNGRVLTGQVGILYQSTEASEHLCKIIHIFINSANYYCNGMNMTIRADGRRDVGEGHRAGGGRGEGVRVLLHLLRQIVAQKQNR